MTSVVSRRAFAGPEAALLLVLIDMQQDFLPKPRLPALSGADAVVGNSRNISDQAPRIGLPVAFMRMVGGAVFFICATLFARIDFRTW